MGWTDEHGTIHLGRDPRQQTTGECLEGDPDGSPPDYPAPEGLWDARIQSYEAEAGVVNEPDCEVTAAV